MVCEEAFASCMNPSDASASRYFGRRAGARLARQTAPGAFVLSPRWVDDKRIWRVDSQALSKIARRHSKDLQDLAHWLRSVRRLPPPAGTERAGRSSHLPPGVKAGPAGRRKGQGRGGIALVEPEKLRQLLEATVPRLYRFPAIDPGTLRRALEATPAGQRDQGASPETPEAG
jgi:hypothetical protein